MQSWLALLIGVVNTSAWTPIGSVPGATGLFACAGCAQPHGFVVLP